MSRAEPLDWFVIVEHVWTEKFLQRALFALFSIYLASYFILAFGIFQESFNEMILFGDLLSVNVTNFFNDRIIQLLLCRFSFLANLCMTRLFFNDFNRWINFIWFFRPACRFFVSMGCFGFTTFGGRRHTHWDRTCTAVAVSLDFDIIAVGLIVWSSLLVMMLIWLRFQAPYILRR